MILRFILALTALAFAISSGGPFAHASALLASVGESTPVDNLDSFHTPAEIYQFIADLTASDPVAAGKALDLMLWQPDRHKRRTSIKEFIATHRPEALKLFASVDSRVFAGYLLRDTMNSTPMDTIATLMVAAPKESSELLCPLAARLVGKKEDDKYEFMEKVQDSLLWAVSLTSDNNVIDQLYREFEGRLGGELFDSFIREGWSRQKYQLASREQRETIDHAMGRLGYPARSYDPLLLDDSNPGRSVLTQARKTRQPLGQESPWSLYLYSSTDTDLEWWDGYRQVTNLERLGSDPNSLQMVAMVDPYSSDGEIRDRVTVSAGRAAGKPRGATGATRTYYIEQSPYTAVGDDGTVYSLDPAKPIQAWASTGEVVEVTIDQLIRSAFDNSPGGYPIVDREALLPMEWDTLIAQNPELKGREAEFSQMITSPVLDSHERDTSDADTLVRFWDVARRSAPARRTMLAVLAHGAGISGIAWDYAAGPGRIDTSDLVGALSKMTDGGRQKIDVLFLQACSMQDVELITKLAPYASWIVGFEPGSLAGQSSLDLIASIIRGQPEISPEQIARTIVSTRPPPSDVLASAVDTSKVAALEGKLSSFATLLTRAARVRPLAQRIAEARLRTPTASYSDRIDLIAFAELVGREMEDVPNANLPEAAGALKLEIRAQAKELARAARLAMPQINVDPGLRQGLNGLSIWFPLEGSAWEGTEWVTGADYFSSLADPAWTGFIREITPFLSPTMVYDSAGANQSIGDARVWRFIDEVTLRPVVGGLVRLGEQKEGIYELAVPATAVLGYSGEQGGGATSVKPDRDGKYRVWVKGLLWGRSRPGEIVPVNLIAADGSRVFVEQDQYHTIAVNTSAVLTP